MSQIAESSQHAQLASETPSVPPAHPTEPTLQPQDTQPAQTSLSSRVKTLNETERYWTWKAGLRAVICVLNIIGIGAIAWLISVAGSLNTIYDYSFGSSVGWQAGVIAAFCVSLIWCFLCILIPLVLRPARPLHPGIAVGVDLILWLGFLLLGLVTVAAIFDIAYFGSGGVISDPSQEYYNNNYDGQYNYVASNNSWVYNVTYVRSDATDPYYNATLGEWVYPDATVNTSDVVRDCTPQFTTCEQQDQYVNMVWHQKPRRLATTVLVDAIEWLNVLLHFTLFVWACVDTHRAKARTTRSKEQIVADRIIADLESKGLVLVKDGVVQPVRSGQPEMAPVQPGRAL